MANDTISRYTRGLLWSIFNLLFFGPTDRQTIKQLKRNWAILMQNQYLQQSSMETNVRTLNITKFHVAKNGFMINRPMHALKSVVNTVHLSHLLIKRLNYAHSFFLTLADIDHRLNQLCYRLNKLEPDISTIYNYINTLSNKVITPTN